MRLRGGHEALLALKEDILAVGLELFVAECFRARVVHELAVPGVLALHAVRVVRCGQAVLLHAGPTGFKITESAGYLFVIHFVEFLAADIAGGRRHGLCFLVSEKALCV
jgi:hypothetical protein